MTYLLKIIPTVIFWIIFIFVVLQVPYPDTITQASFNQLALFFLSLFFAISFSLNIFLKNIFISTSISLGIIFILIMQALNSLNLFSGGLTIAAIGLLISYFRKMQTSGLTTRSKIPTLTKLRKEI